MPQKQIRTVKAGSLHFSNLDKKPSGTAAETSDTVVTNAFTGSGLLVEPDGLEYGSTHFSNLDTKPNKRNNKVSAKKLKADAGMGDDGEDDDSNFEFDQDTSVADDDGDDIDASQERNVGAIENDINPAAGYLDQDHTSEVVNADNEDGMEEDGLQWDESEDGDDDGDFNVEGDEEDDGEEDADGENAIAAELEPPEDNSAVPISDIRKLDDTMTNVAFVMHAGNLLAIKDTTVVAHMTKVSAKKHGILDVYGTKTFAGLMAEEVKKHGLSAALRANNFRTERIDFTTSKVVAKTIAAETKRIQARVQKQNEIKAAVQEQSVAIAAVGMSRKFFKDVPNPLMASLSSALAAAGVRNPDRFLQKEFAAHGAAYIQAALEVANKLAAQSEEVRNGYADALDMTCETMDDVDDAAAPIVKVADDDGFDMEGDDDGMEDVGSADITAALVRRPARRLQASAQPITPNALANAMLNGSVPMF